MLWGIVVIQSLDEAFAPVNRVVKIVTAGCLIAVAVAALRRGPEDNPMVKDPRVNKNRLDELFILLEKKGDECRVLARIMAVENIEQFAEEMKSLCVKFAHQPLVVWADDLYSAATAFDIEKIEKGLSHYFTLYT